MESKTTKEPTVDELQKQVKELQAKLQANRGMTGWLIKTPNANYNGNTMGFRFRAGKAFVSDTNTDAEAIAKRMAADFGYEVERVDAFADMPQEQQTDINNNLIDQLARPTLV